MRNHPVIQKLLSFDGPVYNPDPKFVRELRKLLSVIDPKLLYWTHDSSIDTDVDKAEPHIFPASLLMELEERGLIKFLEEDD